MKKYREKQVIRSGGSSTASG